MAHKQPNLSVMLQLHYVHPIRSYNSTEELLHVYVYSF